MHSTGTSAGKVLKPIFLKTSLLGAPTGRITTGLGRTTTQSCSSALSLRPRRTSQFSLTDLQEHLEKKEAAFPTKS